MKSNLSALLAGLMFGVGLMLSGMINPGEVLGFLDWSGVWNPDLIGVLGSAVLVFLIAMLGGGFLQQVWARKQSDLCWTVFSALETSPSSAQAVGEVGTSVMISAKLPGCCIPATSHSAVDTVSWRGALRE